MRIARLLAAIVVAAALDAAADDESPCPAKLPEATRCWQGRDANGAYYWIARPREWNGALVMHSHGGPRTTAPKPDSEVEDLERFAVIVQEGFAIAASSYREGGYLGVAVAAEDTENLRRLYVARFGRPRVVIAHGQSWGGGVTAHLIERFGTGPDGKPSYDAALLTSGLVAGNARGYDFRADLRAVYQYYCHNHPRSDEPRYALWMGLPADSKMNARELETRVDECTGVRTEPSKRTPAQRRNLASILSVLQIQEKSLVGHMSWATFLFRDIVAKRLAGGNPFTNARVRYAGSADDDALNQGVERFDADPVAAARFGGDGRLTGKVAMPVLTLHAIDDPTVFVEQDAAYREVLERGGSGDRLVQTWTRESEHSYLSSPEYAALLESLVKWSTEGAKPDVRSIAALCGKKAARLEGGCHFDLEYRPRPLDWRQYPR
jgi:hypothetical protein